MSTAKKLMGTTDIGGFTAIEDVFSTYLYTGNGTGYRNIVNNIDLLNEGGMVWIKSRSAVVNHVIGDTEQGPDKRLTSNTNGAVISDTNNIRYFNSNGFAVGPDAGVNNSTGEPYASWTFRKAPRFFDVVTYTGDGTSSQTINHNLGTTVGSIIVKKTSSTQNWLVGHIFGWNNVINLNTTDTALSAGSSAWGPPSDTTFAATSATGANDSGATYVAYLFAHDPLGPSGDGSDGLIACGSYTGTGVSSLQVDIGWEPQWILIKGATNVTFWEIFDVQRGMIVASSGAATLKADTDQAEYTYPSAGISPSPTGVVINATSANFNGSGQNYIYIAIRRGPMRAPTSGTEVFNTVLTGSAETATLPFVPDFGIVKQRNDTAWWITGARMLGNSLLSTNTDSPETTDANWVWNSAQKTLSWNFTNASSEYLYAFSRAPSFFDVVTYTGNGVAGHTVNHNLGVAPELMIVRDRAGLVGVPVYVAGNGATKYQRIDSTMAATVDSTIWNNTEPTDSVFTVGSSTRTNRSTGNYVAYLFSSLSGVSKIGSYVGDGTDGRLIDCGFLSGARFVLIKRSSGASNWVVWDSARGIVSGNDPFMSLNSTAVENTSTDYLDPSSAGFLVNGSAGFPNASGDTYIYLAIA